MNEAKVRNDQSGFERICNQSSLDFPGFGEALKLRDASGRRVFVVKVTTEDANQLLELSLIGDDLGYLFANVRELLLGGVVAHICIDVCESKICLGNDKHIDRHE
jgi:hypothetical protein